MKDLEILKAFEELADERSAHGKRHEHTLCIALFTLAVVSGCRGLNAMGDWMKAKQEDLLELFEPTTGKLPSYSTLRRVMLVVEYAAYAACLGRFFGVNPKTGDMIASDGKVARGSYEVGAQDGQACSHPAIQLVTSYLVDQQFILEPIAVESKSNEITALPEVVKRLAADGIKGVIFAFDALNTQKNSVKPSLRARITILRRSKRTIRPSEPRLRKRFSPLSPSSRIMNPGRLMGVSRRAPLAC